MKLQINGEERELAEEDVTLAALVEQLGMKADRVAVELNREIVRRDLWPQTRLHTGDRLEIVQFVGGGLHWETEKTLAAEDAEKPSSFLRF